MKEEQGEIGTDEGREQYRRAWVAMSNAGDPVVWVAQDGQFVYANEAACRHFGCAKEKLLTLTVSDVDPNIPVAEWPRCWDLTRTAGELRLESTNRTCDGRLVPVELTIKHVAMSRPPFNCVFIRDVSDRKRLEEQFRQAQKLEAVGRLAGGIAHDFNNLLTVITGYSDLLLEQVGAVDPARATLQEISDAGHRAASLTRQLLAFSRKQVVQRVVLNVSTLLSQMEKMLKRLLGEDIRLVMDLDPQCAFVKADPGQIEQVIMNLAVNARDAMAGGGQLIIEARNVERTVQDVLGVEGAAAGSHVGISVADTGYGMTPAVRAHLFEPFFTTKEVGKGTGLGLSTVYGIVRQSEGHISVESEPGRGSKFTVYLPACGQVQSAPGLPLEPQPLQHGREKILLAEDEQSVRTFVRVVLEAAGYDVLEASDAIEALRLAVENPRPIDLLVTDMIMPGLLGEDLARLVRQRRPSIRVLYISGYTDRVVTPEGGAFLQKPFTPMALAAKVRETLSSSLAVA